MKMNKNTTLIILNVFQDIFFKSEKKRKNYFYFEFYINILNFSLFFYIYNNLINEASRHIQRKSHCSNITINRIQ